MWASRWYFWGLEALPECRVECGAWSGCVLLTLLSDANDSPAVPSTAPAPPLSCIWLVLIRPKSPVWHVESGLQSWPAACRHSFEYRTEAQTPACAFASELETWPPPAETLAAALWKGAGDCFSGCGGPFFGTQTARWYGRCFGMTLAVTTFRSPISHQPTSLSGASYGSHQLLAALGHSKCGLWRMWPLKTKILRFI